MNTNGIKFLTISSNRAGGEVSRASFASADQPCTVDGYRAALASVGNGLRFGGVGAELNGRIIDVTPLIGATDADTVTNVIAAMLP